MTPLKNTVKKIAGRIFKRTSMIAVSALCLAASAQQAVTAQNNVIFGANVTTNNACIILVRQTGELAQSVTGDQLSSRLPGGRAGIADVFAVLRYDISVDVPPFFSSRPIGGDDNVTFSTFFSGQPLNARGASFGTQPGNIIVNPPGFFSFTRLTVDLEASRPDPFPAGNYTTEAIVRCE